MQNESILEFDGVNSEPRLHNVSGILNVTLKLYPGEIAMVLLEDESEHSPLCDLAEGLIEPDKGSASFMGEQWQEMSPLRQSEMRGKIARVFGQNGWVSNLNVYENITLAERHHTSRTEIEIRTEVQRLCEFVGMTSIPEQRPDLVTIGTLRRAEWVRAFLGNHVLLLLERPELGAPAAAMPRLFDLTSEALARHSSIIWTTLDKNVWQANINRIRRFKIKDGELIETGDLQ